MVAFCRTHSTAEELCVLSVGTFLGCRGHSSLRPCRVLGAWILGAEGLTRAEHQLVTHRDFTRAELTGGDEMLRAVPGAEALFAQEMGELTSSDSDG